MMIDYIKVIDYRIHVCSKHEMRYFDQPFTKYMNKLLRPYLVNLQTREKLTKRLYGFKHKTPIFLDVNHLFLCVNSYRLDNALYINYFQLVEWRKDQKSVILFFRNNHCMRLKSYHGFMNQVNKIRQMLSQSPVFINNP